MVEKSTDGVSAPSPPRKKGGDMSANCNKIHDNQVIPNQEARADDVATHLNELRLRGVVTPLDSAECYINPSSCGKRWHDEADSLGL